MYLGTRKLWRDEMLFYEVTHTPWGVLQAKYLLVYKTWNLFKQSFGFVSSLLLTFCELPPFNHKSHTHHSVNRHKWEQQVWPWTYAHFYLGVKLSWFVQRNKAIFSASGVVSLCRQVRQHILWPYFSFLNFIFHITSMALTVDAHSVYRCLVLSITATCSMWMSVVHYGSVIRLALI